MIVLLAIVGLIIAGFILLAMVGAMLALAKLAARLAVAGAAAIASALLLPLQDGQGWVPYAVFLGVILATGRRNFNDSVHTSPTQQPVTPADIKKSWAEFRRLTSWREARRLDEARETCERYLLLARGHEEPSAQLPLRIGRHLPEQMADCIKHCSSATTTEQRALIRRTLASIEGLAAHAERRRRELADQAQLGFLAREAHLARADD